MSRHSFLNSSLPVDYNALADQIRLWGAELGLTIGFSAPSIPTKHQQQLTHWLAQGFHGEMTFFHRNQSARTDPTQLQAGTLSVISARLNYWDEQSLDSEQTLSDPTIGYISRYALGRDYHKVLKNKLKQLCLKIEQTIGSFMWRPFTDSAPIMEHALAEQAGLGFIGKHTLLIHPQAGSTFFLGEVLCNLPLPTEPSVEKHGCGSCQLCLNSCPTHAIIAPFTVDARRCISYLTIEHQGSIDEALRPLIGNRIYGCDDCQLCCPWNKFAQPNHDSDFTTRHQLDRLPLLSLWQWSEREFLSKTEGSPIRRIGYQQWRRNLAIALGNAPFDPRIVSDLNAALPLSSALVQEHILWALSQQQQTNKLKTKLNRVYLKFKA